MNEFNNLVSEVEITYINKIPSSERVKISNSEDCVSVFKSISRYNLNLPLYECFYAMYINRATKVLSVMLISEGGTCGTFVDIKKVLAPAILQNASGIILSHNHPSGNTEPSESDKDLTNRIVKSASLMGIKILDHVILTEESFYSFADNGLI